MNDGIPLLKNSSKAIHYGTLFIEWCKLELYYFSVSSATFTYSFCNFVLKAEKIFILCLTPLFASLPLFDNAWTLFMQISKTQQILIYFQMWYITCNFMRMLSFLLYYRKTMCWSRTNNLWTTAQFILALIHW